ncbi:MAG: hypothetical protein JWM44_4035 [Bacilli bacterium]|nr:hypothetical protein [Bacilli bacterium]
MKMWISFFLACSLILTGCNSMSKALDPTPNQMKQPISQTSRDMDPFIAIPNDAFDHKFSTPNPVYRERKFTISQSVTPTLTPTPSPVPKLIPPKKTIRKKKEPSVPVQQNQNKRLTLPQLRSKYPQYFKLNGSTQEKKIALTFDDGPDNHYTVQILDILRKYHVPATFFLVGVRAEGHPALVKRIVNEGHVIGNHSYNHANPAKLTKAQFEQQIESTQIILQKIIGYEPKLIRTPYGAIQEEQLNWAANHGFIVVNWDIDSYDWKQLSSSQVLANILSHKHKGAIVLQHSAGGNRQDLSGTVQALPLLIEQLKAEGYQLVTVPQLLHITKSK